MSSRCVNLARPDPGVGYNAGAEVLLAKYPIFCNNSAFDIRARGVGRVEADIVSPDPDATARAISSRLTTRLKDPGGAGAEEACCVS